MFNNNSSPSKSTPISIDPHLTRRRSSLSESSSGSSNSPDLPTPLSSFPPSKISIPSPGSSPILSYFLAQSPTTTKPTSAIHSATFPFKRGFGGPPVFEGVYSPFQTQSTHLDLVSEDDPEPPVVSHARRASSAMPSRLMNPPIPEPQHERGTGVLRRLSLSSSLTRPGIGRRSITPPNMTHPAGDAAPPSSAVSTSPNSSPNSSPSSKFVRKPGRSATISVGERPRRAPSPMGERILKGHFDGFN